ncbi:tetratricopeptide (TPR) repeat protein [Agrobacterium larrymoorei]|uniref:Tetratricopeptide (TPR) repeat protein n=1 Tax=Agrobacterium larrymoorei TaxID=160699 RepID=A0ABU0UQM2_9HYPH|nr:tetratricopeptide (TPR) repeat protein [Agrobacterium larrymoorei]
MNAVDTRESRRPSALSHGVSQRKTMRLSSTLILCGMVAALAGCATTTQTNDVFQIDRAQGSEQNIASLTSVINANPQDPEGYNVRGSAYGRAGDSKRAIADFNQALQLNPRFYQAYANRALVYRNMGQQQQALQDYNSALQINPNYDVALIGRGNLYRQTGRTNEAFNDFTAAINTDTTDGRAYHNRGLIYPAAQPAQPGDRRLLQGHLALAQLARAL